MARKTTVLSNTRRRVLTPPSVHHKQHFPALPSSINYSLKFVVIRVIKPNLMHYLSSVYFANQPLHASDICSPSSGGILFIYNSWYRPVEMWCHTRTNQISSFGETDESIQMGGGRQFSRLPTAEACVSAVVMLDTPCSEVVWRVLATHSIRQFSLHVPSSASQCAITFQLDSTSLHHCYSIMPLLTCIALNSTLSSFNPLNAELNPICHLLALLGVHHIFYVSGLRVNVALPPLIFLAIKLASRNSCRNVVCIKYTADSGRCPP